jgi:hypothetical protein
VLRGCGCALAGLLVLAGCSSGGTTKNGQGSAAPSTATPVTGGSGSASAPPPGTPEGLVPVLDESKQPRTAAEARALIGRIMIDQGAFGPDVVRATPFESDPARWPVLDAKCVWQTSGLPADVLATSTRHFQIPAGNGRGRLRLNATVTVHHNREESGWETAGAMEEVARCPDQKLREGEQIKGLWGISLYQGEQGNGWTEDAFNESGKYLSQEGGGPYPYAWNQAQFGPVTVAVTGKGAAGYTDAELTTLTIQGTARLMAAAKTNLGKGAG